MNAMLAPARGANRRVLAGMLGSSAPRMSDLTRFLHAANAGDEGDDGVAIAALYEEIRRLARTFMRSERPNHTLPPTAVANEAYLRLFGGQPPQFASSSEFLAAAVTTLRRVLVEHGRRRARYKRGGGRTHEALLPEQLAAPVVDERLVALDEALGRLAAFDPAKAKLVELRFFGGLSVDEAAAVLGQSPRTAAREWRVARAFLRTQLDEPESGDAVDD